MQFHHLRLALWRQGYAIPETKVKATLEHLAFRSYRQLASVASRSRTPEEAASQVAANYMEVLPRSKIGRAVRRRLHNDAAVQQMFTASLLLALGGTDVLSSRSAASGAQPEQLAATLIRAIGLDVGRTARIGDAGPWITGDPAQDLLGFEQEGLFSSEFAVDLLRAATEEDLVQARADADIFVPGMLAFVRLLAATGAPEVFGWFFKVIDVEDDATGAQLIVMMLMCRRLGFSTALDTITDTLHQQLPRLLALDKLIAHDATLSTYLNPNTGQQAVLALDETERTALQQRINAFLDQHPDIARAVLPPQE
jgi:hypothetical protein